MKKNILLFFILSITLSYSQNRKEIEITRFNSPPVIDGVLPNPSLIPVGFSQRDNIWEVNADSFWLSINTNDDNLNDQGFQITSAGTLGDTYTSGEFSPDDWNFDTVFEGKVSINEKGWSMEMKIPYSALRFPTTNLVNFIHGILLILKHRHLENL